MTSPNPSDARRPRHPCPCRPLSCSHSPAAASPDHLPPGSAPEPLPQRLPGHGGRPRPHAQGAARILPFKTPADLPRQSRLAMGGRLRICPNSPIPTRRRAAPSTTTSGLPAHLRTIGPDATGGIRQYLLDYRRPHAAPPPERSGKVYPGLARSGPSMAPPAPFTTASIPTPAGRTAAHHHRRHRLHVSTSCAARI
jgi:hypothetical protein